MLSLAGAEIADYESEEDKKQGVENVEKIVEDLNGTLQN